VEANEADQAEDKGDQKPNDHKDGGFKKHVACSVLRIPAPHSNSFESVNLILKIAIVAIEFVGRQGDPGKMKGG